jgi:hypothetical protein
MATAYGCAGTSSGRTSIGVWQDAGHHIGQGETAMPFYENGDLRIRYEEVGTGLTREDYLNSRMVAYPFCLFDCDIPV